jgi:hypothetical protein
MSITAEEMVELYTNYKQKKINNLTDKAKNDEGHVERHKTLYENVYNKLITVSSDFRFDCVKKDVVIEVELFDIDGNGSEIKWKGENGETTWFEPKEVIKIKSYVYDLKITYTGVVPEGHDYYVIPVETYSKWSYRITGCKMQVQGTGINSWDRRGQMTNPKSVHNKILETVDNAFKQIEYKTAQEQRNNTILNRFKIEFGKYINNFTVTDNTFVVKLDNGISVTFYGHEDSDGYVTFTSPKVNVPYGKFEVRDLLNGLDGIKVKE